MALYDGSATVGRTGPYWRRQQGTTLPGERTGAELQLVNAQRARLGLPPLGGPAAPRAAVPFDEAPGMPGVQPMPGEGAPRGVQQGGGGLGQLPLPQLLALRALLARGQGGAPAQRAVAPVRPSVLPQLGHRAVQVRPHTRIIAPRPALGPANLPSY